MGFTQFPSGSVIYPSDTSYLALDMDEDVTLAWPVEQQIGGDIVASIIDIDASVASLSISLGDARQVTTGYTSLFNNVGAHGVTVLDAGGNTIATIAPATAWQIYLHDNSTENGSWRIFQYASTVSTAVAAQLVGAGLKAIATTLNFALPVTSTAVTPTTLVSADRAKFYNWTGGVGILNLPAAATAGNDWNIVLRNSGSGNWTVTPPSGTIDGDATKILSPGASCLVVTDGANFYTLSSGSSSGGGFNFIAIDISGTGDYTLAGIELNQIGYSFTGLLTGNRNVIVPGTTQQYWVANNTTGAFSVFFKTAAQTPGVEVLQGDRKILYCDGTNVYNAESASVTFPIPVAQGGTGATTATNARTNLSVPPLSRIVAAGIGLSGGGDLSSDRTISLSFLGLEALSDPNADRILFWDDSAGAFAWLEAGSGLSISSTTITATGAPIVTSAAASLASLAVGQSAYVFKPSSTNRNSTTTLASDPNLVFTDLPVGRYTFEGFISYFQNSATSQGLKFSFSTITSGLTFHAYAGPDGSAATNDWQACSRIQGVGSSTYNHNMGASATTGSISFRGDIEVGFVETIPFQWAQESSSANNTTLFDGSWMKVTRLS